MYDDFWMGIVDRYPLTDIALHCGEWGRDEVEDITEVIASGHTWLARFQQRELEGAL